MGSSFLLQGGNILLLYPSFLVKKKTKTKTSFLKLELLAWKQIKNMYIKKIKITDSPVVTQGTGVYKSENTAL